MIALGGDIYDYTCIIELEGRVRVDPPPQSTTSPVKIRLVQYVGGGHHVRFAGFTDEFKIYAPTGQDGGPWDGFERGGLALSGNELIIIGADAPNLKFKPTTIDGVSINPTEDLLKVETKLLGNVYMQYRCAEDSGWTTIGKVQWNWEGETTNKLDGTFDTAGGIPNINGSSQSRVSPQNPPNPWPQ